MALELSRERRIDWARIIANLRTAGMDMRDIAEKLDVGISTLKGYMNEDAPSEPAYWVGHGLIELWALRCSCPADDVPTVAVDCRPKREIFHTSVMRNDRITNSLEQLSFAWFGAVPEQPSSIAEAIARRWPQSVRFRVGIARTTWDSRPVSAFVVYDEATERRVQGSREFIEWRGGWQEYALGQSRDTAAA